MRERGNHVKPKPDNDGSFCLLHWYEIDNGLQESKSGIVPIGNIYTIRRCRGHGVEYISILRSQYHVVIVPFQGLIEHQNTLFFAWKVEK